MPTERNSRPTDARTFGSSSMTNTVEVGSDIAATHKNRKTGLCLVAGLAGRRISSPYPGTWTALLFLEDAAGTPKFTHTDTACGLTRRPTEECHHRLN